MNSLVAPQTSGNVLSLRDAVSRVFDDSFVRPFGFNSTHSPLMDVYETNEAYVVKLAVPGLKADNFDLSIEQNVLTIRGNTDENTEQNGTYLLRERAWGNFVRTIQFPAPVNANSISATLGDGILNIQVPKAEHARPHKITIRTN